MGIYDYDDDKVSFSGARLAFREPVLLMAPFKIPCFPSLTLKAPEQYIHWPVNKGRDAPINLICERRNKNERDKTGDEKTVHVARSIRALRATRQVLHVKWQNLDAPVSEAILKYPFGNLCIHRRTCDICTVRGIDRKGMQATMEFDAIWKLPRDTWKLQIVALCAS